MSARPKRKGLVRNGGVKKARRPPPHPLSLGLRAAEYTPTPYIKRQLYFGSVGANPLWRSS